jgi:hypothetical protein
MNRSTNAKPTEKELKVGRLLIKQPMSNTLIQKFFNGKANIIALEDITQMTSLDQVFKGNNHVIIFLNTNPTTQIGHWICLFINAQRLFYFDSYGEKPLIYLQVMQKQNIDLGNQNLNLLNLIRDSIYKNAFYYNTVDYQSEKNDVATCGRYTTMICILNIMYLKEGKSFDLKIYYELMNYWKDNLPIDLKTFDRVTTFFVNQQEL